MLSLNKRIDPRRNGEWVGRVRIEATFFGNIGEGLYPNWEDHRLPWWEQRRGNIRAGGLHRPKETAPKLARCHRKFENL
jgi:hypothetical protein